MASLASLGRIVRPFIANRGVIGTVTSRNYAYWNQDWKPGPFPKTPEERAAAAKKYGLRPEDYEPYPDDGMGFGDYPKLPYVSGESRDPYENWDNPEYRRNYGEPLHVHSDIITEDKWDSNRKWRFPLSQQYRWCLGIFGGFFAVYWYLDDYKYVQPYMPKVLPKPGEKHYTFEPAE